MCTHKYQNVCPNGLTQIWHMQGKCQLSSPCCVSSALLVINEVLGTSSIPCSYSRRILCLRVWLASVSINLGVRAAACCLLSLVWDRCALPFFGAILLVGEFFPDEESYIDGSTKFLRFMWEQCPESIPVISTGWFFQPFCVFWCSLLFPSLFHPFIPLEMFRAQMEFQTGKCSSQLILPASAREPLFCPDASCIPD